MTMITVPERAEYRKALKQLSDLKEKLDFSISRGQPLDPGVMLAMEKMTGTSDIHGQYRALDHLVNQMDTQYDEKLRYAAQFRFSPFCEYMYRNEPPAFHHEFLIEHMEAVHNKETMRLAVSMPPGSAKALVLDTPIPTPYGWTTMGDLRVGDKVFDENGNPCNVTAISPVFKNRPVYDVKTDCGDVIVADRDHEWNARLCSKRPLFKNHETHVLAKKRSKRPMIKRAKALNYTKKQLSIDPYFLGIWLGDGTSASMSVTCGIEDQDFIIPELQSLGYTITKRSSETLFGVSGVRHLFTDFGLLNDPHHNAFGRKHIPDVYMQGSKEQRLSLLQGLVDSDGTVCKTRGCTTFCNTNKELALQCQELVRSLGVKAGFTESRATLYGKDCGPVYRVSFYLENSARLPRKNILTRNQYRTPNTENL